MDGTLLNANQEVSEANQEAIQEARARGIDFLVATGRSYHDMRYVLDHTNIDCPAILLNGAEIRDENGEVEYGVGLDEQTANTVASVLNRAGVYFELYTSQGTYTTSFEKGIQAVMDIYRTANPSLEVSSLRNRVEKRFKKELFRSWITITEFLPPKIASPISFWLFKRYGTACRFKQTAGSH